MGGTWQHAAAVLGSIFVVVIAVVFASVAPVTLSRLLLSLLPSLSLFLLLLRPWWSVDSWAGHLLLLHVCLWNVPFYCKSTCAMVKLHLPLGQVKPLSIRCHHRHHRRHHHIVVFGFILTFACYPEYLCLHVYYYRVARLLQLGEIASSETVLNHPLVLCPAVPWHFGHLRPIRADGTAPIGTPEASRVSFLLGGRAEWWLMKV